MLTTIFIELKKNRERGYNKKFEHKSSSKKKIFIFQSLFKGGKPTE
jgi:hypothetical protein